MSIMNCCAGSVLELRLTTIAPPSVETLSGPNTSFSVSAFRDSITVNEIVVPNSVWTVRILSPPQARISSVARSEVSVTPSVDTYPADTYAGSYGVEKDSGRAVPRGATRMPPDTSRFGLPTATLRAEVPAMSWLLNVSGPIQGMKNGPRSDGPETDSERERVSPLQGQVCEVNRRTPLLISRHGIPAHHVGVTEKAPDALRPRLSGGFVVVPRLDRERDIRE